MLLFLGSFIGIISFAGLAFLFFQLMADRKLANVLLNSKKKNA